MRQTTPHIMGALRLLADSAGSPTALNNDAWSLYADFRPEVSGWGGRGEVRCERILSLRRTAPPEADSSLPGGIKDVKANVVQYSSHSDDTGQSSSTAPEASLNDVGEPVSKKARMMTLEEYEAMLDDDTTFDNVELP
ncbi:hypothetical protein HGRIS_009520 [Hohenbuehelia grisea]|uniref:Uncharacterized protein n=1 Tax=Hohenbuehelia grisea TaxID=104357 RepID=A0ABR3J1L1_9AGAR